MKTDLPLGLYRDRTDGTILTLLGYDKGIPIFAEGGDDTYIFFENGKGRKIIRSGSFWASEFRKQWEHVPHD